MAPIAQKLKNESSEASEDSDQVADLPLGKKFTLKSTGSKLSYGSSKMG